MQGAPTPKHKNPPKKLPKGQPQKTPDQETALNISANDLQIPGVVGRVVAGEEKKKKGAHALQKRLSFACSGPVNSSLYKEEGLSTLELLTCVYTEDGGKADLIDLEVPDNHPEGKFFIRITDGTEDLGREPMGEYRVPISIGAQVEEKGKGKAKAKGK